MFLPIVLLFIQHRSRPVTPAGVMHSLPDGPQVVVPTSPQARKKWCRTHPQSNPSHPLDAKSPLALGRGGSTRSHPSSTAEENPPSSGADNGASRSTLLSSRQMPVAFRVPTPGGFSSVSGQGGSQSTTPSPCCLIAAYSSRSSRYFYECALYYSHIGRSVNQPKSDWTNLNLLRFFLRPDKFHKRHRPKRNGRQHALTAVVVGGTRLELATSCMSSMRSSQLS